METELPCAKKLWRLFGSIDKVIAIISRLTFSGPRSNFHCAQTDFKRFRHQNGLDSTRLSNGGALFQSVTSGQDICPTAGTTFFIAIGCSCKVSCMHASSLWRDKNGVKGQRLGQALRELAPYDRLYSFVPPLRLLTPWITAKAMHFACRVQSRSMLVRCVPGGEPYCLLLCSPLYALISLQSLGPGLQHSTCFASIYHRHHLFAQSIIYKLHLGHLKDGCIISCCWWKLDNIGIDALARLLMHARVPAINFS